MLLLATASRPVLVGSADLRLDIETSSRSGMAMNFGRMGKAAAIQAYLKVASDRQRDTAVVERTFEAADIGQVRRTVATGDKPNTRLAIRNHTPEAANSQVRRNVAVVVAVRTSEADRVHRKVIVATRKPEAEVSRKADSHMQNLVADSADLSLKAFQDSSMEVD